MLRTRLAYLLFIPLAVLLMGATTLVDPPPISVPSGFAAKDVSKAIRAAIVRRGWVARQDEKGVIDAVLDVRKHSVNVAISYDTRQITIKYVSSSNLDYEEKNGERKIHKKYNQWIGNMVTDIQHELQATSISKE